MSTLEAFEVYAAAHRRLREDALLRARADTAAQAVQRMRRDPKTAWRDLEDDVLIAAMALVVAELVPPEAAGAAAEAWQRGLTAGVQYATGVTPTGRTDTRLPDNPYLTQPPQRHC